MTLGFSKVKWRHLRWRYSTWGVLADATAQTAVTKCSSVQLRLHLLLTKNLAASSQVRKEHRQLRLPIEKKLLPLLRHTACTIVHV